MGFSSRQVNYDDASSRGGDQLHFPRLKRLFDDGYRVEPETDSSDVPIDSNPRDRRSLLEPKSFDKFVLST
jgi:hypothetical protein